MFEKCASASVLIAALILALGIAAGSYFITQGLIHFRSFDRSVSVKGLAVMDVEADLVLWPIKHAATGNDLPAVQQSVEENSRKVIAFLKAQGLTEKDIAARKIEVTDLLAQSYRPENAQDMRFIVSETVMVRTNSVDAVDKASQNVGDLLRQGVSLARDPNSGTSGFPEYIYTKLNDIKPGMIAEATRNARASAAQFAKDSGAKVGAIKDAYQGVFEILPRDSGASYTERQERHKTVRVVATLQFYLE
jgi:uncharacterized protein